MSDVKKIGNHSFVNTKEGTYALAFSRTQDDVSLISFLTGNGAWENNPVTYGEVKVVPFGADNNMPAFIRSLLEKNNLGPGVLQRQAGLQYGQGPFLYRLKYENNDIVREWVEDEEIQAWLDSWDYKKYIRDAIQDFNYMQGIFVKYYTSRGRRLGGKPWISKLECKPINDCRLEWPENDGRGIEDCKSILVGDFESLSRTSIERYPVFNPTDPTASPVSMRYHNFRSFGRNFYSMPSFMGAIPWIQRANDIPEIIKYLTDNMIAAAYHVHEPAQYWEDKRDYLQGLYPEEDEQHINKRIDLLRDELTKTLANVLAGKRNVGKFIETIDFVDPGTNQKCEWKIEAIEMNIDKYIEAQTKISRIADSATTSGMGLSPALSNIIIDGKGDSGSQMLYALKIFYASSTQIIEDIVFEPIHYALKVNFPKKNLSMGLFRKVVNKEDNVTAGKRTTNQM